MTADRSHIGSFGSIVFFAIALVVAVFAFLFSVIPPERQGGIAAAAAFDPSVMREALTPAAVESWRRRIQALGPRGLGQPGHAAVGQFLAEQLRGMGLAVITREDTVAAPVTETAEILGSDGAALPGVTLHPFLPNLFQPIATPGGGLQGRLVLLDDETIRTRPDFSGVIGVVDMAVPPASFALQWTRYAQLGIEGLILTHREGIAPDWLPLWQENTMVSALPVNFLRAFSGPEILEHLGQDVNVRLKQRYRAVPNTSIVARIGSESPAREALVVTGHYDAYGLLPSLADGSMQAYSPASVLALAQALIPYRKTLTRDVIFVLDGAEMMGGVGEAAVISAFGPAGDARLRGERLRAGQAENTQMLERFESLLSRVREDRFLQNEGETLRIFESLTPTDKRLLVEQLRFVMNALVFSSGDEVLEAKLPLNRRPTQQTSGPEYDAYQTILSRHNAIKAASSAGPVSLVARHTATLDRLRVREKLEARLEHLVDFHRDKERLLVTDIAINELASAYEGLLVLSPRLLPGSLAGAMATVALLASDSPRSVGAKPDRQGPLLTSWFQRAVQKPEFQDRINARPVTVMTFNQTYPSIGGVPVTTKLWNKFGYPAFTMVNADRLDSYRALTLPAGRVPDSRSEGLGASLEFYGELVLSVAHGAMAFRQSDVPVSSSYSGRVFASNVGQSVVPNFPLEGALVGENAGYGLYRSAPGYYRNPLLLTDPHGRYELLDTPADFQTRLPASGYSPQGFFFNESGAITWVKDQSGKGIYRSDNLPASDRDQTDVHLVLFRAAPVSFLDLTDPQTMEAYVATTLLSRGGLSAFRNTSQFAAPDVATLFAEPDRHFFAAMRAGQPDNPLVQTIRGLLLGPPSGPPQSSANEINGAGYLAADHPLFPEIARPMAGSMLRLNEARADLQDRRHMLDPIVGGFIDRSARLLAEASAPGLPHSESVLAARESAAYSALVHPILRANINGAVISILWYLGLLVPFVFFMEKLVFGFADIRKQLAAQAVLFLIVFGLLRLMHPAFEMIQSSFMILLGFVILLIAGGVTLLFAGKFRETMEALESLRGRTTGAGVNTSGIIVTAFMLGLNNMHRRKVRTGLTCATLVLITFAMIAFTSVRSDFVESTVALGPASYQGLLIQKQEGKAISTSELFALQTRFANRFPISARTYLTGRQNSWNRESSNPAIEIRTVREDGSGRSTRLSSILQFDPTEPLRAKIPLLTKAFWFAESGSAEPRPVLIPDRVARDLGVTVEQVNAGGGGQVLINGGTFRVAGIFDGQAMAALRDLDGHSLLPPDVTAIPNVKVDSEGAPLARPEDPRISAEEVVILPSGPLGIAISGGALRIPSVVVGLESLGFREAREVVFQYLEQTGTEAFFGLDGVASYGKRSRETSVQGLLDMIMPLVIAALTVLNTMKGSVYERRDEIYVYNAVGIAPRYIFFMFFAEAFVYSVVGAVLGYLLSQGTGFVLTAFDLTGGLNMTFAGPSTIFASLAVIAAVFVSTIFPARTAMQIAAPSEESSWALPEAKGDEFGFNLPFTFNPHDRLAVLAFFQRFLVDHGEGGSGRFSAGPPALALVDDGEDPVPQITTTIWLKPYDLGVSQVMVISLPRDVETPEYVARIVIERLSGTRESWKRLNRSLMVQIRQQFLHWRAVSPAQKKEYFAEALSLLEEEVRRSPAPDGVQPREVTHV